VTNLSDELNDDWLRALNSDADHIRLTLNRIEHLGVLALDRMQRQDYRGAIKNMAEMGEGIRLVRTLMGLK
jgi:hypothetical protein